ncbi:non-specific lipid-transfer protein 3-like [Rosa rugosa]|uniref:non-specific lipid-transfer protein 3-like n=1 Tax=Rosa rugosa TaxID=74645 RepID=UPI002B41272D|nr:non-specific lipid-transfer protein 3-like [Rosa rugosa]
MSHLTKIVVFLVIVLVSESAMGAPECAPILRTLDPCLPYLVQNPGREDSPSKACCDGLTTLSGLQNVKDECECIKATVLLTPLDLPRFAALPSVCGTTLKIPTISGDMDCSKIKM